MPFDPTRRQLVLAAAGTAAFASCNRLFAAPTTDIPNALKDLEKRHGGRLGVGMLDTGNQRRTGYRTGERFPMCSTFKLLAAAAVLSRVDAGAEQLERRIEFSARDLVPYSPVTEKHIGSPGLSLAELCHAAITVSDNTAGNLLLDSMGGPNGLTTYARTLGDPVTRLDRRETALNEAIPGDPRDTTTPAAMLDDMCALLVGDALSPISRQQLADWLVATTTGGSRLRARMPVDWRVGDKTGTSDNGVTNDVAIAWPPGRAPLLVTAYYAESKSPQETRNRVLAEVGGLFASWAASH